VKRGDFGFAETPESFYGRARRAANSNSGHQARRSLDLTSGAPRGRRASQIWPGEKGQADGRLSPKRDGELNEVTRHAHRLANHNMTHTSPGPVATDNRTNARVA
jgi:hypothetical protein